MDHLQTEARNPASTNLDELTSLDFVRLMNDEDAHVIPAVRSQAEAIARAIDVIAERLRGGGRLIYAGAGTSGRLGVLDATECPPTFNAEPEQVVGLIAGGPAALTRAVEGAEDEPERGARDLEAINLTAADVLVGIATSGRTPYVLGALAHARQLGAFTIGLACNADAELVPLVDLAIVPVVGAEILSGSTRLKAGTATKLVLNMLSTGAMVRLGKTFGNLMVDLRATNVKLRARSNRIVRMLTGLDVTAADALLEHCGRELKTALVAQLGKIEPEAARRRLEAAKGRVGEALVIPRLSAERGKNPANDLILGIDGGGTQTTALLAKTSERGWTLLGRGEAGPSNLQAVGIERAGQALDEAVNRAFRAAGLERVAVAAACLGLAGAGRPADQALIRAWTDAVQLASRVEVMGDTPLLLAAGTPDGWGVALVAGTGSMAYAQTLQGRTKRVGGWGYLLGDEGSGYALSMAALRTVMHAADGRLPRTALTEGLLGRLNLQCAEDLIQAVYRSSLDRTALAALAPVVLEIAEKGDEAAAALVREQAEPLALMVATAVRGTDLEKKPVPLALAGGLLLGSAYYRDLVLAALPGMHISADPVTLVAEPAEGALRRATGAVLSPP